jgi:hypothetical protein
MKGVGDSRDLFLDLFTRIENIFKRLETYIEVPPTPGMTGAIVGVMVEVLCVLAIMTKEIKQSRASELKLWYISCLGSMVCRNVFEKACGKDGH